MAAHACNTAFRSQRPGIRSLRPAWTTESDTISKKEEKNKTKQKKKLGKGVYRQHAPWGYFKDYFGDYESLMHIKYLEYQCLENSSIAVNYW